MTTALFVGVGIPLWACTVLPLSICYQCFRLVTLPLKMILGKSSPMPAVDSGYVIGKDEKVKPLSERPYDIVVLGATGLTGKLATRYLAQQYGVSKSVKWAIAGRNQGKLDQVKQELATELSLPDMSNLPTIVVDTSVPSTMPRLVRDTRCVATTAGPYSLLGNSVVEFCVKFGTHYVDITGEVEWIKDMVVQWQDTAKKTGAKLVPFCGHDCIPWDISVYKMNQALQTQFGDELKSASFWDQFFSLFGGGTLATVCAFIDGTIPAFKLRKNGNPFLRKTNGTPSGHVARVGFPVSLFPSASPWDRGSAAKGRWTTPNVMAHINGSIVQWSHALRPMGSKNLSYRELWQHPNFSTGLSWYLILLISGTFLLNPWTRHLIDKMQQGKGPKEKLKVMEEIGHLTIFGEGVGVNGNRVESVIYFPKDAGILETSRMMIEAGLCLALEEPKILAKEGGFWTSASGLGDVLLERLLKTGTTFDICAISKDGKTRTILK